LLDNFKIQNMSKLDINSKAYQTFFAEVCEEITRAQINVANALNNHQNIHYFNIGKIINNQQTINSWGKSIVNRLSKDLTELMNGREGYSPNNLWNMRKYFLEYQDNEELFKLSMNIPWMHNILIIEKIKDLKARAYYLSATAHNGWSRNVLLNQIKADAYSLYLQNPKQHNFELALPEYLHEQASEALKSVYTLDFLGIAKPVHERKLENLLIENVKKFLLELGYGFCFIGNQYRLELGEKEYFVDLLFYHRILKCLVAIELKAVEFEPEFVGKLDFYLQLIDENLKQTDDNPSIGILLCTEKNHLEVEYALRTSSKPIGVAQYQLTKKLPDFYQGKLPTAEELNKLITHNS